jgi:hypothetical protein
MRPRPSAEQSDARRAGVTSKGTWQRWCPKASDAIPGLRLLASRRSLARECSGESCAHFPPPALPDEVMRSVTQSRDLYRVKLCAGATAKDPGSGALSSRATSLRGAKMRPMAVPSAFEACCITTRVEGASKAPYFVLRVRATRWLSSMHEKCIHKSIVWRGKFRLSRDSSISVVREHS